MYYNFINIPPTVLFKVQCLIVQQMSPLVTVSGHWSLFEFSQQRHDMLMNDDDITWHIITYSKISNDSALFCLLYERIQNTYCLLCLTRLFNYNFWVKNIFQVLLKISRHFLANIFPEKLHYYVWQSLAVNKQQPKLN